MDDERMDAQIRASDEFQQLLLCFSRTTTGIEPGLEDSLLRLVKELDGVWEIQFHDGPLLNWLNFSPLRAEDMRRLADAIDIIEKNGFFVNASYGGSSYYFNLEYGDGEDAYDHGQPPWTQNTFSLTRAMREAVPA